ncbi:guanine nucleotide binding protein, alpha subunit [Rhizoclosmatium globosum]|uniref:Guanine nucleotide binding protein, alpha subunit n=1 Tax=Rhizoclosmatium globosum TaxID=329046 RepID=A0A1Y2C4P8_9FUNG|nr:guanine nucleotide binding protein, alpha subunit [Rhizoclosmatium globosum]|eukprot:ORY41926.1 guanine nucleotide binding protein, alpha subunit [Rhizoclosmatium globosum]
MGACSSHHQVTEQDLRNQLASRNIDRALEAERKAQKNSSKSEVKLLLLGTCETGKSTIFKQLKFLYGEDPSIEELHQYRTQILENASQCVKDLTRAMDLLQIPYDWDPLFPLSSATLVSSDMVGTMVLEAVKTVWHDVGVQYCFTRGSEFHLMDCCQYVLDNIERITAPFYLPSKQDILHARELTQKITELSFQLQKSMIRVFDIGGIRGQRSKWAPFFENVNVIIYVTAISAFDQYTIEDNMTNRVIESLNLFGSVCNHPMFKKTALVLFMNKIDLFKKKLNTKRIASYFRDYDGPNTYEDGCQYFVKLFLGINKYRNKQIYVHFTWATDTNR